MSEKNQKSKEEQKQFDPLDRVVTDSLEKGWLDDVPHINMQKLNTNCQIRGLVGEWNPSALSPVLRLFEQTSRENNEVQTDAILSAFASAISYDLNQMRRQFYAIRQKWESQFLADVDIAKEKAESFSSIGKDSIGKNSDGKDETQNQQK